MPAPTRTVSANDLRAFSARILTAVGVPETDAETAARIQVEADLRGVHSHGARAIPGYTRQILAGEINPKPGIRILKDAGACVHIDGDGGLGQVISHDAMQRAIQKARSAGIGLAAVRNSTHYGAAAYYAMMAAEQDLIGFSATGGRKLRGNMAPFGSIEPILGNNPLAYAVPAGRERPIVLDMATGVVAAGKVGMARARGENIPVGWALTEDGKSTSDPAHARVILPLGPKGSGLSLIMNCIGGILPGAGLPDTARFGHLFWAIDIATFADLDVFKAEIDARIQSIREARPAPDVNRVYYPGEIEWNLREERLASGIPMLDTHLKDLERIGAELGVPPPWPVAQP